MAIFKPKQSQIADLTNRLLRYPVPATYAQNLVNFITGAPERDLEHLNPRWLAKQIFVPEQALLEIMAFAIREGLFDLNWEIQCPACRSVSQPFKGLNQFASEVTCQACSNRFALNFDDEVHVTFNVSGAIRKTGKLSTADLQWQIERSNSAPPYTGHELLTVQPFRDFFKNENLPEGESLQVKRAAFMFTDLGGSTALYARKGDPRAYRLVREHFDVLYGAVNAESGAVVKTIGDAIMAIFTRGDQAFRSAMTGQREIARFNKERNLPPDEALILKVGLHAGPCLSVTLNERMDYFGTTVNMAARIQSLSHGDDIVFSEEIAREAVVQKIIKERQIDSIEVQLKGFDYKTRVYHMEYFAETGVKA
jgi:class 3 adenylate cyclase